MRVWVFACVIVVLVAVVAAAVVVLSGGEGEEAVEREAGSVAAEVVEAEETTEGVAEPEQSVETTPTLRYNQLDTTGAATTAGSFTFLRTPGDVASAIGDHGYSANGAVELRIHPTDASGTSRAPFYDTVQVGDRFDYQTNGPGCATRFRVTRVAPTALPRTFGIEWVNNYGGWCAPYPEDPNAPKDVDFVWNPPAGSPAPDGVRLLLYGEPIGEGTYRLEETVPCLIDVPAGSVIFYGGIAEHGPDPAGSDAAVATVLIEDAPMSSSGLHIDPDTCEEDFRVTSSPEADALFDQIMASIRRVDGVAVGGARAPVTTPPEPVTLRYDRLDITGAATAPGSYAFLKTAGDAATAIGNFGYSARGSVELRIHPADASGASRAAVYDTVKVGDSFDYRTNGVDCGFRFKVTSVTTSASPRTFGIEKLAAYGGWCDFVEDPVAPRDVQFVWGVQPGIEGPGGVRVLLYGEPVGEGTYQIDEGIPYVIDVPAGGAIMYGGSYDGVPYPDDPNASTAGLSLIDPETGSVLHIDANTGRETTRFVESPAAATLFDQIMASIRTR